MIEKETITPIIKTLIGTDFKILPGTIKNGDIVYYNNNIYKCTKDGTYSIVDSNNFKKAGLRYLNDAYEEKIEDTIESLYGRIYDAGLNGDYKGNSTKEIKRIYRKLYAGSYLKYRSRFYTTEKELAEYQRKIDMFRPTTNKLKQHEIYENLQTGLETEKLGEQSTSYSYETSAGLLDNIGNFATRQFIETGNYDYGVFNKAPYGKIVIPEPPVTVKQTSKEECSTNSDGRESCSRYYDVFLDKSFDFNTNQVRFWLPWIPWVERGVNGIYDTFPDERRKEFHNLNNYGIYITLKNDGLYELYFDVVYTNCERIEDDQWGDMYAYIPKRRLGVKNTAGKGEQDWLQWQTNEINKYKLIFNLNGSTFSDIKVECLTPDIIPNFGGKNPGHFNAIKSKNFTSRDPKANFIQYVLDNLKFHEQTIFVPVLYCVAGAFKTGGWDVWHPFIFAHIIPPFNLKYVGD